MGSRLLVALLVIESKLVECSLSVHMGHQGHIR
jgi:hypothetical protein